MSEINPQQPNLPNQNRSPLKEKIQTYLLFSLILILTSATLVFLIKQFFFSSTFTFQQYKKKYGKTYQTTAQNKYRQYLYYRNLEEIAIHNQQNNISYTKGMNQFTDITKDQFKNIYIFSLNIGKIKGFIASIDDQEIDQYKPEQANIINSAVDKIQDIDWTYIMPPVKNQHRCASCYAFPVIGSIQAAYFIKYNTSYVFSQQEIIDCSVQQGKGCVDGSVLKGFNYVITTGVNRLQNYKYTSKYGLSKKCNPPTKQRFKISKLTEIKKGDCRAVQIALKNQPLSVIIDSRNWSPYQQGIFDNCGRQTNHGVVLVGKTDDYWLVRNSWGKTWGNYGYMKLARGNTCGLCNFASFPTV